MNAARPLSRRQLLKSVAAQTFEMANPSSTVRLAPFHTVGEQGYTTYIEKV